MMCQVSHLPRISEISVVLLYVLLHLEVILPPLTTKEPLPEALQEGLPENGVKVVTVRRFHPVFIFNEVETVSEFVCEGPAVCSFGQPGEDGRRFS